ncbi:MAG: hypothetical protein R2830_26305 [Saprospiraceae bacterium]
MADFNFFDQFGKKMRSLRPSSRTAGEDWQVLSRRLDAVMPEQAPVRRHTWLAAAALLLLLLGSNLWWGFTFLQQEHSLEQLSEELAALKNAPVIVEKAAPCEEAGALRKQVAALQSDLEAVNSALKNAETKLSSRASYLSGAYAETTNAVSVPATGIAMDGLSARQPDLVGNGEQASSGILTNPTPASNSGDETGGKVPALTAPETGFPTAIFTQMNNLPALDIVPFELPRRRPASLFDNALLMLPAEDKKDELPFARKAAQALTPKTFGIGASGGWLYPLEPDMEHQTGYGYALQAEVGFSRKLSLTAEWGRAVLHYNAVAPDAAICLESFHLPSPEHQFIKMEILNQRLEFLGLGLRYKGMPKNTWHPIVSLGWSGMKVSPFKLQYETDVAGNFFRGDFEVEQKSNMKNFARLGAGVEFPLGKRLNWTLEGYYLHAWRNSEPEMIGVRTGLGFVF